MVDDQRRVTPQGDADTEILLDTGARATVRGEGAPASGTAGGAGGERGSLGRPGEMDVNESAALIPEAEGADIPMVEEKFRAADVREELNESPMSTGGQGYVGQGLDPAADDAGVNPLTPRLSANLGVTRQEDYVADAQEDRLADESDDLRERENTGQDVQRIG